MPDMVHNDANMVMLEPGETKTLIWKFDKPVKNTLEFAWHLPGHLEPGMMTEVELEK